MSSSTAIFTNGGAAVNVIPDEAEITCCLRALDESDLDILKGKVIACAEGAATASGCKVLTGHPLSGLADAVMV